MARLFLLGILIALAFAQAPQDPVRDFCRRYGHQTAIIDRKLYIDGGWLYANPISQNPVPTINHGLLYGDLDKVNEFNFPEVHANLSKNNTIPNVSGGTLWADQTNKVIWLFGGEVSTAPGAFQLWGYDVVLNQWNLSSAVSEASSMVQRVAYGAGTTNNDLGKGYYYGGYMNKNTNSLWSGAPYATNSLIVFDMDHNTLTNKTGPSDGIGRAEGILISIPASAAGMLVYFGGVRYPYGNTTEAPQSMEYIMLYDIADEKWYTQRTSGQIPESRRKSCGGVAMAADKSSYNIYIYGGFGFGENATGYDDVYILTLPTFQWIKWLPDEPGAASPHGLVTCNVVENAQMIVMGGNFTQHSECDAPNVMGMHNLNLGQSNPTNAKWYKFLPNATTYVVPPAIISAIGGSPTGGATKLSPMNGWSDPAIQVYFKDQAQYHARTPTRSLPAATGKPKGSLSDNKSHIGAIVGGAVGGLILIIVAILFFCWHRRRKQQHHNIQQTINPDLHSPNSVIARPELPGSSTNNEKNYSVTQVVHSPASSPHSPGLSPFGTTPLGPPPLISGYPYHPNHPPHDPSSYQQYQNQYLQAQQHPQYYYSPHQTSPQSQYPPYHLYSPTNAYATSPPDGWIPHHQQQQQQQYFPPPLNHNQHHHQRTSQIMPEMPTVITPAPPPDVPTHLSGAMYANTNTSTTTAESDRIVYYPVPIRHTSPPTGVTPVSLPLIKRREVGAARNEGTSSPGTVTTTNTTTTATGDVDDSGRSHSRGVYSEAERSV